MRQVLLQGARILDPMNNVDLIGELLIREGKVAAIGKNLSSDLKQETEVISLEGLVLCPGLIDMHVHLREPGQTAKETIKTGTQAAARGGITSIVCMPNTNPPLDNPSSVAFVEEHCDLDAVIAAAGSAPPLPAQYPSSGGSGTRTTIAVAMDAAFCFYYRDNFDYLRSAGSDLIFFSPLTDPLPQADAYYFGGGYPEVHAHILAQSPCIPALRRAADAGIPVFGECGGLMWLSRSITAADGTSYPMTGLLDADAVMEKRFVALNYVIGTTAADSPVFPAGMRFRGHEFHYSRTIPDSDVRYLFALERGIGIRDGRDGILAGSVLGGYTHMYFGAAAAEALCRQLTRI